MIMDLTFCSAAVMDYDSRVSAFNLLGEKMIFEREKMANENSNETNEIESSSKLSQIMINEKVHITQEDLMATNGVLHVRLFNFFNITLIIIFLNTTQVIDGVLETESALPVTTMLGRNNLTIFKKLIEYGGFSDDFDGLENVTYFIPTDEAFETSEKGKYWLEMLNDSPKKLKNNENLRKFLNYHVAPAIITSKDLSEASQPETLDGDSLRVNLYSTLPNFGSVFNRATINCARLIHFDQDSCSSVVHQVDNVLSTPEKNLLELLEANPQYSEFLKLINKANLSSLLEEASDKGYTVLVPRNDVIMEIAAWFKERNEEELKEIVKNHILNEVQCCSGIAKIQWPFVGTVKTISNNYLTLNRDRRAKIQNAGVTKCDIIANNGIIHEVNDVIQVQTRQEPAKNPFYNMFERLPFFKK
jgi:transforming growth factor-beta-induced protein